MSDLFHTGKLVFYAVSLLLHEEQSHNLLKFRATLWDVLGYLLSTVDPIPQSEMTVWPQLRSRPVLISGLSIPHLL